jgi:hypothetical protein
MIFFKTIFLEQVIQHFLTVNMITFTFRVGVGGWTVFAILENKKRLHKSTHKLYWMKTELDQARFFGLVQRSFFCWGGGGYIPKVLNIG